MVLGMRRKVTEVEGGTEKIEINWCRDGYKHRRSKLSNSDQPERGS
jgi:hypothetical protein